MCNACSVLECELEATRGEYCEFHWRIVRRGDPEVPMEIKIKGRVGDTLCLLSTCKSVASRNWDACLLLKFNYGQGEIK